MVQMSLVVHLKTSHVQQTVATEAKQACTIQCLLLYMACMNAWLEGCKVYSIYKVQEQEVHYEPMIPSDMKADISPSSVNSGRIHTLVSNLGRCIHIHAVQRLHVGIVACRHCNKPGCAACVLCFLPTFEKLSLRYLGGTCYNGALELSYHSDGMHTCLLCSSL